MKEAQIFENWINNLSEGTWALPETPEQQEKLNQLMSSELIVGPDAINATEQLYDLVGDDELFDILNDLADRSEGRANCWDDSDVQRRLAELGIQTPQSTRAEPADVGQDQAPPLKEQGLPRDLAKDAMRQGFITPQEYDTYKRQSNQAGPGKFGDTNPDTDNYQSPNTDAAMAKQRGIRSGPYVDPMVRDRQDREELRQAYKKDYQGQKKYVDRTAPGEINRIKNLHGWDKPDPAYGPKPDETQRLASRYPKPANENAELARMLQHAGVPLQEGVLNDDTGNTWDHLLDRFRHEVEQFKQGDELDSDLYDALFDYYMQHGAMPYGVAKGRTGDPFNWVSDRLADDLGMNENLISPIITAVNEGSCNMTMEGSYCPEHGLAECGGMYEDGGAVGMPYSMGEDEDDFPPVEIRGVGNLINDIPAASKLINPMQPRRSNALSPLEPGDSTSHSPVAHVDLPIDEGVYDPDYRGGHNNEFDELEDLLSKSGMSQDDLMRQRFLASKYGLNTPADMAKLPALKKDAETGYVARKAALDADLEKRNQQYMQDKLTDLEYQQDPVAFLKRRTQQLTPTAPTPPTAPTAPNAPADVAATPGTDYSLPRAKLGSSPSTKLPNFRPEPSAEVPAPSDQTDTRNQKPSIFQQLAQLRNRTRGTMAETSNDDPINSNSAMTGAYYEGKETPTQEGDALLARIKSLALLR